MTEKGQNAQTERGSGFPRPLLSLGKTPDFENAPVLAGANPTEPQSETASPVPKQQISIVSPEPREIDFPKFDLGRVESDRRAETYSIFAEWTTERLPANDGSPSTDHLKKIASVSEEFVLGGAQ